MVISGKFANTIQQSIIFLLIENNWVNDSLLIIATTTKTKTKIENEAKMYVIDELVIYFEHSEPKL